MIIVAGEALIDRIHYPDGREAAIPGGGPYNTARTIGRLGGEVGFLGRLSTDAFGRRMRAGLEADGVAVPESLDSDAPPTLAIADVDGEGVATYRFRTDGTAAAGLTAADVAAALADRPAALHVGTLGLVLAPIAATLADAVRRLDPATLLMVDPNCRGSAIADREAYLVRLTGILARADVVKVSTDDLAYLAPGVSARAAARTLLDAGATLVLVTDGARSVRLLSRAFEAELPVPRVTIVDTVGSGDAFGGAFLAWWIGAGHGRDDLSDRTGVEEATRRAIAVAAVTCQRAGADPPTRAEAGWPAT